MNKEELKELIDRKAQTFAEAFTTAQGKEVLAELESANRAGDLFDPDPGQMARKVGAFEVVQGIRELVNRGITNANKQ